MTWKLEDGYNMQIEIEKSNNGDKAKIKLHHFVTAQDLIFYADKLKTLYIITELQKIALELK